MRFFPSLICAVIVIITLLHMDKHHAQMVVQEKRNAVQKQLLQMQSQLAEETKALLTEARNLTIRIKEIDDLTQDRLETLVSETKPTAGRYMRIEYAPEFRTALVWPEQDATGIIGTNPLMRFNDGETTLEDELMQGFPVLGRNEIIDGHIAVIHIRVPLMITKENGITSYGVVYFISEIDLLLPEQADGDPAIQLECHVFAHHRNETLPNIPQNWTNDSAIPPEVVNIVNPSGVFTLMMRPTFGWQANPVDMRKARMIYGAIAVALIFAVICLNWIGVSEARTSGELSRARSNMQGVLSNLPGVAFTYTMWDEEDALGGQNNRLRIINKEACLEIWGRSGQEIEEERLTVLCDGDDPIQIKALRREIASAAHNLRPWQASWSIRTRSGQSKWLDGRAKPIKLADGSIEWYGMINDATLQIERNQELIQRREEAHQTQKHEALGQLTGGAAHDFNNLLAVIMGNLELLRDEVRTDEHLHMIDAGIRASKRGADLTRNMLAFARKAPLSPQMVHLNELVEESRNWIGRTLPANIDVETNLRQGLWCIEADAAATQSALLNLMLNGRDAMPDGGKLTISTGNFHLDKPLTDCRDQVLKPGKYVMLSVTDTGEGISAEDLPKITEPFYTTKPTGDGSGLGLSMIEGFMKQSGGHMLIDSEPNLGTTMRLFFDALDDLSHSECTNEERKTPPPATGQRILIVEDQQEVLDVLMATLANAGYRVSGAKSGDEAARLFQEDDQFDLLLSDMVMPGALQGSSLALRLCKLRPSLKVVFMSGYANMGDEKDLQSLGHIRLTKPVARQDLLAALQRALAPS
ncbi:hypothetical protein GCM10007939_22120 [Amylibacter marinus]|uniref:histidine kinase n=1 Tax=Amylibacter marinus TaxID=1475483 RepID=A0ABQ5VXC2_9RHOB|nr:ATP-binding protein [Amylibacter marinus]GLQ35928.1 hypothetical protein GCM10007939_22120 [Amylibacter marinus]